MYMETLIITWQKLSDYSTHYPLTINQISKLDGRRVPKTKRVSIVSSAEKVQKFNDGTWVCPSSGIEMPNEMPRGSEQHYPYELKKLQCLRQGENFVLKRPSSFFKR